MNTKIRILDLRSQVWKQVKLEVSHDVQFYVEDELWTKGPPKLSDSAILGTQVRARVAEVIRNE